MGNKRVLLIGSEPLRMTRLKRTYRSLKSLGLDVAVFRPLSTPSGNPRVLKGIIRYLAIMLQILIHKADIYHFYNIPDIIGLPLVFKRGTIIYDVRSPWFSSVKETVGLGPIWKIASLIERLMTRTADIVLTANTPLAERAKRWGAKIVVVIPNFPPSDFGSTIPREETRTRLGLSNSPTILFLGKLSKLEGSELLKDIIYKTCLAKPDAKFLIVGDGPSKSSLETFVEENHLSQHVIFSGWVKHTEVANYIEASDICVFPRLWTSFSPYTSPENILKVGEYLKLGKPVVAPKMGGFVDATFPVIVAEPEDMAKAVIEYLSNPIPVPHSERPTWEISERRLAKIYRYLGCLN